jgi:hypothetical protein
MSPDGTETEAMASPVKSVTISNTRLSVGVGIFCGTTETPLRVVFVATKD